jgi:DnaJ-class molecular chaperone
MPTYYEILGIARAASVDEIRRAFRREAKKLHPDKAGGQTSGMVGLNEAYETLRDPDRRREYDRTLVRRLPPPRRSSTIRSSSFYGSSTRWMRS